MNQQLRNLLLIGGALGVGYYALNHYSSGKKQLLPLEKVRKIVQQIKHQILIVAINFTEGSKETLNKLKKQKQDKSDQLIEYFRTKMADIYNQKQDLILGKYGIEKQSFSLSLQKYKKDAKLKAIQNQIIEMMDKSINGILPDLTVDKRASNTFSKQQLTQIYQQMSKMILVNLVTKLQSQKQNNPNFDSNDDGQFKKVIREINIYDKKIQFFKSKGFKEEWGCPNQTFFKLSEGLKQVDPQFKQQMKRLQQIYERVVDIAARDPSSVNIGQLNDYYTQKQQKKQENVKNLSKSAIVPEKAKQTKQSQNYINLNKSTRSQPEAAEQKKQQFIESNEAHENKNQEQHQLDKPKSVDAKPAQILNENKQQQKVDDVPNDAKQLQKQVEQIVEPIHEQAASAKTQQQQPNQQKTNISLDSVPIKHQQPQVQHQEPIKQNEQPKLQEQPKVQEQLKVEEQAKQE